LSWGRALGPFGGLSTTQLLLPAAYGKKEKKKKWLVYYTSSQIHEVPVY